MKLEIELSNEFVKNFMERHQCKKNDVLKILTTSILEDKESIYYRDLSGKFDIDGFLIAHSLSQLATMRSKALTK